MYLYSRYGICRFKELLGAKNTGNSYVTEIFVFLRLNHFCLFYLGDPQRKHGHRRAGLLVIAKEWTKKKKEPIFRNFLRFRVIVIHISIPNGKISYINKISYFIVWNKKVFLRNFKVTSTVYDHARYSKIRLSNCVLFPLNVYIMSFDTP